MLSDYMCMFLVRFAYQQPLIYFGSRRQRPSMVNNKTLTNNLTEKYKVITDNKIYNNKKFKIFGMRNI